MSSYLKLIGSIIIGGLLLLSINRYNSSFTQSSHERTLESINIQKSSSIVELIEHDFNRMGFGIATSVEQPIVQSIVLADTDRISFLSDIDEDGTVDTLKYILSDTSAANGTENPRDRILYRLVNNEPQVDAALGVTRFHIRYFDSIGNETADSTKFRTFEITLIVESTIRSYDQYPTFHWQTRITPPCISRY